MNTISTIIRQDVDEIIAQDNIPWTSLENARILVTGANGMIPFYTVLALVQANQSHGLKLKIYALARSHARAKNLYGTLLDSSVIDFLEQDVTSPLPEIPELTHIIHGASAAQPKHHSTNPAGTLKANVFGTHNLLEMARQTDLQSFTLMSSAEVYGDTSQASNLVTETDYGGIDILNPRACYSEGKRASETFAAVYHAQYGIPYTAARFGHIYGPGLLLNDGRVQADFARDVISDNNITLKSAGLAQRTYTYVADAVSGMFTAILEGESGAYNVSARSGLTTIRGLAEHFLRARPEKNLQLHFEDEAHQYATSNVEFQGLDSAKLMALGWSPMVPLDEGIDRYLRHLEQQRSS